MKKLGLLVMPLMAVSLLVNCGGGSTPTVDIKFSVTDTNVTFDFSTKQAVVNLDWTPTSDIIEFSNFTFTGLSQGDNVVESVTPGQEGNRPLPITITFNDKFVVSDQGNLNFHYLDKTSKKEGEGKVEGINVKLPLPWYLDNDYLNSLTPNDVTKEGGEIQTLKVNGLDHQVRLIGVGEDYEDKAKTKPIHTTWEFVNLISDANGYSLALQWNDTNETATANHKYDESTIHNALNGEDVDDVLWAQKGQTTWSDDYKCSVLDMLNAENEGFGDVLKAPSKYINIWNDEKQPEAGWDDKQTINDKLFLLTPKEMGYSDTMYQETTTSTYSYYEVTTDAKRIKKQINGTEICTSFSEISSDEDQTYEGTVNNYAGNNSAADEKGGGIYWLRSPYTGYAYHAWSCSYSGYLYNYYLGVYSNANAVAPAFCI